MEDTSARLEPGTTSRHIDSYYPAERIVLDQTELGLIEARLSAEAHVGRYRYVRQFCEGTVLDCACGAGYGAFILQRNPDVRRVIGVDASPEAIRHAKEHFSTSKTMYLCDTIEAFAWPEQIDVLVSLETIEHLAEPAALAVLATRNRARRVVLSFPAFKSTHMNPFHLHDLTAQDILRIFGSHYEVVDQYDYLREVVLMVLEARLQW